MKKKSSLETARHAWFRPIQERFHLPPLDLLLAWFLMLGSAFGLYYWNYRFVSDMHDAAAVVNRAGVRGWEELLQRELETNVWDRAVSAIFDPNLIAATESPGPLSLSDTYYEEHPVVSRILVVGEGLSVLGPVTGSETVENPGLGPVERWLTETVADYDLGTVVSKAFLEEGEVHQIVAVRDYLSDPETAHARGILVSMEWMEQELARLTVEQQGLSEDADDYVLSTSLAIEIPDSISVADGDVAFGPMGDLLPFVRVRITDETMAALQARSSLSFVLNAVSSALFLTVVLLMGVHIVRARKALETAQRRSAIVGSTSHALRTPLTILSLYADTLAASQSLAESDREYSEIIARECSRMLHQVEDGLNFARIAAGRQTYRLVPDDVNTLVQTSFASYERYLARQGYKVETFFSDEALPIDADGVALSFALDNVIQNAIKYDTVERSIEVATFRDGNDVVVEITDHGVGIPEAEQEHIFDEFYRASTASQRRGWGLGLYIVKHVIEGHRGSIDISSTVGEGTRVRMRFPLRRVDTSSSPKFGETTQARSMPGAKGTGVTVSGVHPNSEDGLTRADNNH